MRFPSIEATVFNIHFARGARESEAVIDRFCLWPSLDCDFALESAWLVVLQRRSSEWT